MSKICFIFAANFDRMSIFQNIANAFRKRDSILWTNVFGRVWGDWKFEKLEFADAIFLNLCDILTDLSNDVTWKLKDGVQLSTEQRFLFADFKTFFERWGQVVLNRLFEVGYVVIGYKGSFRILSADEYDVRTSANGSKHIEPKDSEFEVYVLRSTTYTMKEKSDRQVIEPFLSFLDSVLNASNTVSSRLGSLVVMSPEAQTGLPTTVSLTEEQKRKLESDTQKEYGSLSEQKQLMVLPRTMRTTVINLAGLDQRTVEKARLAILAICDRIKVPANQVAIIDANSSKSLANGSEYREGDFAKYQSFERLLSATFVQMAIECGLPIDYEIYNKPTRQQTPTV